MNDGEFREDNAPPKTAIVELKEKIEILKKIGNVWTVLSLLFSTGFLIYSIFAKFGNGIYRYVSLGVLGAYIFIFLCLFFFSVEGKKKKRMLLKTYKKGIGIFKSILALIRTALTITIILTSFSGSETNRVISLCVAIFSFIFAILSLVFKIILLILKSIVPRLASLGVRVAKEYMDEKINENPMLENVVNYLKKKNDKKKAKKLKAQERAERKLLKERGKALAVDDDSFNCISENEKNEKKKSYRNDIDVDSITYGNVTLEKPKSKFKTFTERLAGKFKKAKANKNKIVSDDTTDDFNK